MRVSTRQIGLIIIILGILLFLAFQIFHPQVIRVLESTVSADGEITPGGMRQLNYVFYFFTGLLTLVGLGMIKIEDDAWRKRVVDIFLSDPVYGISDVRPSPKFMLLVSTTIGLFLIIHIRLYDPSSRLFEILYLEDGIFESLTPILMLASIILTGMAIPNLRKDAGFVKIRNTVSLIYLLLMLLFFVNAMEEISWGQRIFGWETPQLFAGNVQEETNLHNFFNQYYLLFYRLLVFFPLLIITAIWLEIKERYLDFNRLVLPHPSMIGLSLLIALVSLVWFKEQELLEEMFAVFFMFYSLRVYNIFRIRGRSGPVDGEQGSPGENESIEAPG